MKLFRVVAAAVASVMLIGSAAAADPAPVYIPGVAPVVAAPAPAFSFAGTYFGVTSLEVRTLGGAGLFGFNIVRGRLLAGIELRAGAAINGEFLGVVSATARAGVLLGDRVALYGLGGAGILLGNAGGGIEAAGFYTFGTGLEYAVSDRVSVFGETRAIGAFGGMGGFAECCAVQVGVRIHR